MSVLKWYSYEQNNSGGFFIINDDVAHAIFVQASSSKEANEKASRIVDDYLEFCACCGERWWIDAGDDDGTESPEIYGVPIYEAKPTPSRSAYILYYTSGDKRSIDLRK